VGGPLLVRGLEPGPSPKSGTATKHELGDAIKLRLFNDFSEHLSRLNTSTTETTQTHFQANYSRRNEQLMCSYTAI